MIAPATQHRWSFWLLVLGTTVFLSIEPALFLVVSALALSAVTIWWVVLLVAMLLADAFGSTPRASRCVFSSLRRSAVR